VQLRREGADSLGGFLLLRACLIRQVCLCLVKEILGVCLRLCRDIGSLGLGGFGPTFSFPTADEIVSVKPAPR